MKSSSQSEQNSRRRKQNQRRPRIRYDLQSPVSSKTFKTRLKYAVLVANTSGSYANHYLRGNSPYDPAVWSTNVQSCLGFSQLADFYNRYRSTASRLEVTIMNKAGSATGFPPTDLAKIFTVVVFPSPYTTPPNDLAHALEQPGARYHTLSTSRSTGAVHRMNLPWVSTKQMVSDEVDDEDYSAMTSQNPERFWVWHIGVYSPINSQLDVSCMIKIEYDVTFFDRARVSPE